MSSFEEGQTIGESFSPPIEAPEETPVLTQQEEQPQAANDDPRKAAVAAAIARVQAKKAAQQAVNED